MDQILINLLNGLSSGLLLFMLSSGLTLIFSMMGVLNFAHASFYMLGAYIAYTFSGWLGFWPALLLAPVAVGLLGALFERSVLRRVHRFGHVPELLITFGLSYVILELVQLIWGRVAVPFNPPAALQGAAFTIIQSPSSGLSLVLGEAAPALCSAALCSKFPLTRAFVMLVALAMLLALWLMLTRTRIGLVIQAALTHPEMVEALGHNVPRVFMLVFGSGCALAALAGVIGGITFVTEPAMATIVGSIIFVVVVVGGVGSLAGAFVGSILIGLLQTLPLTVDSSLASLFKLGPDTFGYPLLKLTLAQVAPILPYLLMVLILIFRPKGLLGTRDE
ncbi:branched-chain amino acid ABC transporter permease [Kinneretia asaccharophila]|uniref:Amino acid/amide ABC transporter membrane protein 1 (HAAT family) n=2 Tax=Roseateles asaccharophilus TaxID=582607 RepID=A0A4R6N7R2_9BURK|nr:branched-chain amino acid ABC transporter permease [Roseateles asaccharophilus]MDN3546155.1 branched-chain amino acid ABC transporter permease [Roseateles asaccharophilus]TDP11114.1 amino acid/amide ABC transporter membrane protein 1 (HAAT family) [Roseateles asaccharophilus]